MIQMIQLKVQMSVEFYLLAGQSYLHYQSHPTIIWWYICQDQGANTKQGQGANAKQGQGANAKQDQGASTKQGQGANTNYSQHMSTQNIKRSG